MSMIEQEAGQIVDQFLGCPYAVPLPPPKNGTAKIESEHNKLPSLVPN